MKLLLLEDDERVARGLTRLVIAMGHEILHARNVAEAKGALGAQPFELIIADVGLGNGESGLELLHWARQHHPQVRRVLTSGAVHPAGFLEEPPRQLFLHKPFGRNELQALFSQ